MNRLILLGNGFDLAHGLKTDYNNFIVWYLKRCFTEAFDNNLHEDELIRITKRYPGNEFNIRGIHNVSEFVDFFYDRGFDEIIYNKSFKITGWANVWETPFTVTIKTDLLKTLILQCTNANWIDIENEFYEQIKYILKKPKSSKIQLLNELNTSLKSIIQNLETYLETIPKPILSPGYKDIFEAKFNLDEIIDTSSVYGLLPENSLVLNFNYTSTVESYFGCLTKNIEVNYIHGKINSTSNPVIFGFGDELDDEYNQIELEKINEYFKYIKSFWYFKTSNYHNLIRFIEMYPFQVYILGHSCGLSDRTMLNMVFEHSNCKSIKIFYHEKDDNNNYENLTQEISRHFKNKVEMRRKIVSFDKSFPMPQVK